MNLLVILLFFNSRLFKKECFSLVKPKTTIFQRKIPAYEPPSIKQPITKPPMQKQVSNEMFVYLFNF